MAATDDATPLRLLAFATFRAATFVVSLALYLHLTGRLPGILRSLNTELGFAAFSLLWATTLLATRAQLRRMPDGDVSTGAMVMSTTVAGLWNGLYVWMAMLVVLLVMNAMSGGAAATLIFAVIGSVFGGMLAFTIGAVVGLVYGSVDAVLLQTSAVILQRITAQEMGREK
jgi:hypothetical protein